MPNRLARETSPYLLQHANNPVDWYPWGEDAFARARAEDKPILLSIGYSACHWCHVMEHESFEDPAIASLMNQHFVSVKVDREERPDLDAIYMEAVQAMTGRGGWPMTVFLTPEGQPFYGGTYFPPADRLGMPGFPRVLASVAAAYQQQRSTILQGARQLGEYLRQAQATAPAPGEPSAETLDQAARDLLARADPVNGGFGGAPKFPAPMALEFLLRTHHRTGDAAALGLVVLTLDRMARGGIYDQLGGGFHRYSVDERWLVPHFEKMLYDNALLGRVYLLAYQATGNAFYRRIAEETLDYVRREMTSPEGGFYSTQDADSEGEEGKYYVWTPDELAAVLRGEEGKLVGAYFGVTRRGNFEGRSVLHVPQDLETFALRAQMSPTEASARIEAGRQKLLAARERRVHPGRDEKVLASWNGLMFRSFAEAASALGRADYRAAAEADAGFLLDRLREDGRLLRGYKDGQARVGGYLEDHADVAAGLLALYEATFDLRWLREARTLADRMLDLFWSPDEGAFYDTAKDHEALIVRPRSLADNATPSGAAMAVDVLLRLAALVGDRRYAEVGRRVLASAQEPMRRYPSAFGQLLCGLDFHLARPVEVALVGQPGAPDTEALLAVVRSGYRPNQVVALRAPGEPEPPDVPLLAQREARDGRATAYVCQDYVCQRPVNRPEDLARDLAA